VRVLLLLLLLQQQLLLLLLCSSGIELQPPTFVGSDSFNIESAALFGVLSEARVHKTPQEIAILQYVSDIGSKAHIAMMQVSTVAGWHGLQGKGWGWFLA
jgi:hypothetical protein